MRRRDFLQSAVGGAAAAALAEGRTRARSDAEAIPAPSASSAAGFVPCINQATTMKADFRTAMDAYAKAGFRDVELWLDSVEPFLERESVATARRVMSDHGLEPVSACCESDLFFPRIPDREKRAETFKRKLGLSAELGARRFVMYSAVFEEVHPEDYDAALPRLREVGEWGKEAGVRVGIEFIRGAKFLGCLETTAELLRRVGHPNLGVLVDTFHFYAGTSKMEDFETLRPGEISFVHINDVPAMPRELLEDAHRVFLGRGVLPLEKILRKLAGVYHGPLSFEVFQYGDRDPYDVAKTGYDGLARLLSRVDTGAREMC